MAEAASTASGAPASAPTDQDGAGTAEPSTVPTATSDAVDGRTTASSGAFDVCNDGLAPYRSLQDAVDAAAAGAVLTVCAGTWDAVEIHADVTLVGAGADVTVIEGGSLPALTVQGATASIAGFELTGTAHVGVYAVGAFDSATVLISDCAIRASHADPGADGGGIHSTGTALDLEDVTWEDNAVLSPLVDASDGGSVTVRHNAFAGNGPSGIGGGKLLNLATDTALVSNDLFVGNAVSANNDLIDVAPATGESASFLNNTVADNDLGGAGGEWAIVLGGDAVLFEGNIVAGNDGGGIAPNGASLDWSDVWGNTGGDFQGGALGLGGIAADPDFVDAAAGDYTLTAGSSPCINTGNPDVADDDPDGSRNDLGAYGGPGGAW